MAGRGSAARRCDVDLGAVAPEALGPLVAQSLAVQGFCVLDARLEEARLRRAAVEAAALEFHRVNAAVAAGLLGAEGSAAVADLPAAPESLLATSGLEAVDRAITRVGYALQPYAGLVNLGYSLRSATVVHRTGDAVAQTPELTEAEVSKWQSQFIRHRVMALLFLGPGTGFLQLQPYEAQDAALLELETLPGSMVLLCADSFSHQHFCAGDAYVLSCFFMSDANTRRASGGTWKFTPPARAIEAWVAQRLWHLKELESLEADVDAPEPWRRAASHACRRGQAAGVCGDALRQASALCAGAWSCAAAATPDYAQEVPLSRWDHGEWYDAGAGSWAEGKTYCRHGCFAGGIDQFDNKLFDLSPEEAREIDPHQRLVLEVAFSALTAAGMARKRLRNANGGVFVGCEADEWAAHAKAGCRCIENQLSMVSGRLSFFCGMKGPAMTLTAEGASGLSASHMAADAVLTRGLQKVKPCEFAVAAGISLMLSPVGWAPLSARGWLSKRGRCLTFDSTADGFIRGDGCAAIVVKTTTKIVDGTVMPRDEKDEFLGTIAGSATNNNGRAASLTSPHGPAEQDCATHAIDIAGVRPVDVESIETSALGSALRDAVEVSSHWSAHRGGTDDGKTDPLCLLACKSSVGNQVEASGLFGLLKAVYGAQWGRMAPSLHLCIPNVHIDPFTRPIMLADEAMGCSGWSSYAGVMAQGLGGTNVYVLTWSMEGAPRASAAPRSELPQISFWPGGGGEMEGGAAPKTEGAYFVVGTWCRWETPEKMESSGMGEYTFEVALGENRWEQFQIWLDGSADRVLHPGAAKMPQGCPVLGPDPVLEGGAEAARSGLAPTWIIDGRGGVAASKHGQGVLERLMDGTRSDEEAFADVSGGVFGVDVADAGMPGDRYRILLQVAGRWRMVTWTRLPTAGAVPLPPASEATYQLAGSWSGWELEEMLPGVPGVFTADVRLPLTGIAEFQIVRDMDWSQTFYPNPESASLEDPLSVLGPDDLGWELSCWAIEGRPGDWYSVQFRRTYRDGVETRRVRWKPKAEGAGESATGEAEVAEAEASAEAGERAAAEGPAADAPGVAGCEASAEAPEERPAAVAVEAEAGASRGEAQAGAEASEELAAAMAGVASDQQGGAQADAPADAYEQHVQ